MPCRPLSLLLLLSSWLCCATPAIAAAQETSKPMTKRQQTKLVEEFMALNLREEVGFERAMAIVDALESVPLPRASDIKKWRKNLAKLDAKMHRELDKKPGTYHYWEKERRGKFIIGGDTKKPRGLLLGMHGGGVGSGDASSSAGAYSNAAKELDLIAIFPEVLEKTEHGWTDSGTEEWVMDLVDAAIRTWEIDPNLVYFSGHSMGGYGSWTLGAHHADRVAALAPSAGAPTPVYDKPGGVIVEVDSGVVPNLRNIAMVVFQSIDDPRVPPDVNQAAVQEVERAKLKWGGYDKFTYWEVNGRGHGYPEGGMLALLERIVDFERDPLPQKIVWQPRLDWKHQYHWLYWQRPIENAIVVSEYHRDSNTIEISSEQELKHMWVLLDDRLVDMKNEVTIKVNGEITNQALPQGSLGALLLTTSGPDTALSFPARLPIRGTLE